MVAPCQRFTHQPILALKFLSVYVHRGTLPQLRCAQQLPQRGSREGCVPFIVPLKNRNVAGDFHRPYEAQKFLHFTIQWPTERVTKETRNQYEIS